MSPGYDAVGNLLDVTLPDGRFIEYLTDGRNRRIAKKVNGVVVRRWVYQDQLNPTAELDGSGTVLYRYAYGSMAHSPDFVVNASGETYRVIRDQLGSPLLVVNIHDENDVLLEANHSAQGPLDFKFHADALDTFQLPFGRVRPDEFGNYLTGYATSARLGILGELETRLGGHAIAFLEGLFERRFQLDNAGSIELINRGVHDAKDYRPEDNVCQ